MIQGWLYKFLFEYTLHRYKHITSSNIVKKQKTLQLRFLLWTAYIYVHSNTINEVHGDPENDKVIKEDGLH